jgi:uncharacterized protein DUF4350
MTSVRERASRVPVAVRAVVLVVLALVALNLGARALDQSVGGSDPSGSPASSYATVPSGLAAYAELLRRWDHPVSRQRGALVDGTIDPAATLMVLDPAVLEPSEAGVVLQFVVNGGRLVIGGQDPQRYLRNLRDRPPQWTSDAPNTYAGTRAPFEDLERVVSDGSGAWNERGTSTVVVAARDETALLTRERVGRGEMLFLADVSPLTNASLGKGDNAAFGLLLAGRDRAPVVFAEGVHGYGATRGLAALPQRWKLAFAGLGVAALALIWARARRLGPPEEAQRALPPPRRAYVDALGTTLERTRDPATALARVRDAVRAALVRRGGLDVHANTADVDRIARELGFDDRERTVLARGVTDDDDVRAIGTALARVTSWDGGRDE